MISIFNIKTLFSEFRDFEDGTSLDGSIEHMERGSLASFGSGNTTDSDNKVGNLFTISRGFSSHA